jgi:phosphatidylinositol 4-kinase A
MPVLVDVLRDVPFIDFDPCLSWEGDIICRRLIFLLTDCFCTEWALPDQLVFSTVSALLRISSSHGQYGESATTAILDFIAEVVRKINTETCQ